MIGMILRKDYAHFPLSHTRQEKQGVIATVAIACLALVAACRPEPIVFPSALTRDWALGGDCSAQAESVWMRIDSRDIRYFESRADLQRMDRAGRDRWRVTLSQNWGERRPSMQRQELWSLDTTKGRLTITPTDASASTEPIIYGLCDASNSPLPTQN